MHPKNLFPVIGKGAYQETTFELQTETTQTLTALDSIP